MKRRRTTPVQRLRPFWFLIAIVLALLVAGGYLFSLSHTFYPHTIVVSGNRVVSKDAIMGAAQIELDRNIWLQNTAAMTKRIEAIPFIDTAVIHRHLPGAINIDVTERTPFAVLDDGGSRALVDRRMRVLRPAGPDDAALPVLVVRDGQSAPALAIALDAALIAHLDPASFNFDKYGDVEMTLRGGVRVYFGDPSTVAQKVTLVQPILAKVERGNRKVAALDLRAMTTPVVVYAK